MDQFYTTGQAARRLRCSPELVRYLHRVGQLPAIRAGRYRLFSASVVDDLAKQRRRKPYGYRWKR